MNDCLTLLKMRIRQQLNSSFKFGYWGWVALASELAFLVSLIFMQARGLLYIDIFLLLPALMIVTGNGYLNAAKSLNSKESQFDITVCEKPLASFLAGFAKNVIDNIRVSLLFPVLALMLVGQLQMTLFLFVMPIAGSAIAVTLFVLIQRFFPRGQAAAYLLFALLYISSTIVALVLLLLGNYSSMPMLPLGVWQFTALLSAVLLPWFLFLPQLSRTWHKGFTSDGVARRRIGKALSPRNGLLIKEFTLVWRHPLSLLRIVIYFVGIVFVSYISVPEFFQSNSILFLLVWLLSFGEMPATAWQNDGSRIFMPWLAGKSPRQCLHARALPYALVVLFGVLGFSLFSWLQNGVVPAINLFAMLLLLSGAVLLAMAVASIGYGKSVNLEQEQAILEQVPHCPSALFAFVVMATYLVLASLLETVPLMHFSLATYLIAGILAYLVQIRLLRKHFQVTKPSHIRSYD